MRDEQPRQTSPAYAGLPIFRAAMDFAVAIDHATANFSRRHRYGIGEELRRASLRILLSLPRANRRDGRALTVVQRGQRSVAG